MTAPADGAGGTDGEQDGSADGRGFVVDRHLVLDQLGGWRGMVDASLPTVAFIVANGIGGLTVGIWAAVGAAVLVFLLRLLLPRAVPGRLLTHGFPRRPPGRGHRRPAVTRRPARTWGCR